MVICRQNLIARRFIDSFFDLSSVGGIDKRAVHYWAIKLERTSEGRAFDIVLLMLGRTCLVVLWLCWTTFVGIWWLKMIIIFNLGILEFLGLVALVVSREFYRVFAYIVSIQIEISFFAEIEMSNFGILSSFISIFHSPSRCFLSLCLRHLCILLKSIIAIGIEKGWVFFSLIFYAILVKNLEVRGKIVEVCTRLKVVKVPLLDFIGNRSGIKASQKSRLNQVQVYPVRHRLLTSVDSCILPLRFGQRTPLLCAQHLFPFLILEHALKLFAKFVGHISLYEVDIFLFCCHPLERWQI